jgi:lipopolysaccharide transport system permease protein
MISAFNPKSNFQAFKELLDLLTRHRTLTFEMARREILDRYAGQYFGVFWTFFHPIVQVLIYIFLFNVVYTARTGGTMGTGSDMTVYILSGFIPWFAIQDVMAKSSGLMINNANLVKQVIFPLEVLPVKSVLASLVTEVILYSLSIIYVFIRYHTLSPMLLLLPVFIALEAVFLIGVTYLLSSVGVYFRDVKDIVTVFIAVVFWVLPILYLPESIPAALRPILYINPLSYLIWCSQDILYFGTVQHPAAWIVFPALSIVMFIFGYRIFRRLKVMFGNAL